MARVLDTRRSSRLLLAGLILGHLIAISRQVDGGGGVSLLERTVFSALAPLQALVAAGVGGVRQAWTSYVGLRGAREESRRLAMRVGELEAERQRLTARAEAAGRLEELLGLRQTLPLDTLAARVIARDGTPHFRTLTIDRGSADGVRLNAPVISFTGVVGRVIRLGPQAAHVQLLIDQQSGVGVRIQRSRVTGVVSGRAGGRGDLVLKYVPRLEDVAVGDAVVTSGLDRIYPPDLMVGRVHAISRETGLFQDVSVTPSARFDILEQVLVIATHLPDASVTETVR